MIMNILIIVAGLFFIIFYKWVGSSTANIWYRIWHMKNMDSINPPLFWKSYEKICQLGFLLGGLFAVVINLLALLGIIHWRE